MLRRLLAVVALGGLLACAPGAAAHPLLGDAFTPVGVDRLESPPAPLPLKPIASELLAGNPAKPNIALTFDAGADGRLGPKLLEILRDKQVRSTFFITGLFARQYPLLIKQIAADGHELANHTWDHTDLTTLNDAAVANEITKAEDIISTTSGESTKPLFRFPYGARTQHLQSVAAGLGYRSIYWTTDSLDWEDTATVASITNRVLGGARNGAIVLMHVGATYTTTALPNIIDTLRARGFNLVTVTEVAQ